MASDTPPAGGSLRAQVAALLKVSPADLPGDANLIGLGFSSLDLMRLSSRLRRAGTAVDFDTMVAEPTIDAWQRHIDELRRPRDGDR